MHVVKAPYVMLKVVDGATGSASMRGLYAGQPVPSNVDEDSLRRHLDEGLVEEVADPAASEPAEPEKVQEPAAPVKPAQSAPKADWVDFAVASRDEGTSEEDARAAAEGKSKVDLIAEFGG